MSLNIKFLKTEQIDKVLHFFNNTQSDKERVFFRSRKEFEWLFVESVIKPSFYVIASDSLSDEIVGTNAGIIIPMVSPLGEPVLTCKSEDSLLSLDLMIKFGKRDVLKEMLDVLEERYRTDNVNFVWGITKAKSSFKRCGYTINNQVRGSFYVIKPMQFYKYRINQLHHQSIIKKLMLLGFAWNNCFKQLFLSITFAQFALKQIRIAEIDEEILKTFLPKNVYTLNLNKEFLSWRISGNPSSITYGLLEFRDLCGKVISYFIFSYDKGNCYFIEQFLFHENLNDKEKIQIMKRAFGFIKKRNAMMIRAMGFTDNELNLKEIDLLRKTGFFFFENKEASYFILKNINKPYVDAKDIYLSRLNTLGTV